jgi:hypothetical protein
MFLLELWARSCSSKFDATIDSINQNVRQLLLKPQVNIILSGTFSAPKFAYDLQGLAEVFGFRSWGE